MQQQGSGPRRAGGGLRLRGRGCGREEVLDREEQVCGKPAKSAELRFTTT